MADTPLYRVAFINQGKVYEIYARKVYQGDLYGFVQVEDLVFGENTTLVLDPSEERLKDEFAGVSRFHIPMHSVIRIDEVLKEGTAKIRELNGEGATVMPFPGQMPPGGKGSDPS